MGNSIIKCRGIRTCCSRFCDRMMKCYREEFNFEQVMDAFYLRVMGWKLAVDEVLGGKSR
ncbi:MAG: hypothetical protein KKE96_04665 [Candidatus Altiarchaeota archaeon]|nr:hypothetical protein [Candidatus Altiarchaeota archaeon]MBU4266501.1 hypothetical protein [Candidatus Altiarchaeota archaeon]